VHHESSDIESCRSPLLPRPAEILAMRSSTPRNTPEAPAFDVGMRSRRTITVIGPPAFTPLALFSGIRRLVQYRDLLFTLTIHRVKVRYKQSVLGLAWAVLQPFLLMVIYTVIFSYIVRMPSDGAPYAIFAYAALLPWTSFSTALTTATNGVVSNANLVSKVYFPREILPLSYVLSALVDLAIASVVMLGLLWYYRIPLTWNALYVFPIVVVMLTFATAGGLFLGALNVRIRDIGVAMPLLLQLWMYATPVVYPISALHGLPPTVRTLYQLNPLVGVVENFRRVLLQGIGPDWTSLGTAALISLICLPVAYLYFKQKEATMADVI
jgi:lipopolysaccharide transport system permease protein